MNAPIVIDEGVDLSELNAKGVDDLYVLVGGGEAGRLAVANIVQSALADADAEVEAKPPRQRQNLDDIPVLARMKDAEALRSKEQAKERDRSIGPNQVPHTEAGNGERLELDHGDFLRFCPELGHWLVFDGKRWSRDDAAVNRMMLATVRVHFYPKLEEFESALSSELKKKSPKKTKVDGLKKLISMLRTWINRSESAAGIKASIQQASTRRALVAPLEGFDAPSTHGLLNCANGTVDLRTGRIRPHKASDFLTNVVPFEYIDDAPCPGFVAVLERILPDADVREFVLRYLGYAATGYVFDHVLPIFFGDGANGKGTLAELVKAILGPYALATPDGFFEDKKFDEHPTEIARLRGVRLALASETRKGAPLAEAKIKKLTGGDTLTGRKMREDFFDFEPTAKYIVQTNHRPQIHGNDGGIRRRVLLVHFGETIPEGERNPRLKEELLAKEASGILRLVVEGARDYLADGLRVPESIRAATAAYLDEEDIVSQFIDERCVFAPGNRSLRVPPKQVFLAFKAYAEAAGERAGTLKSFGADLRRLGVDKTKSNGTRFYVGLSLRDADDPGASDGWEEHPDDFG